MSKAPGEDNEDDEDHSCCFYDSLDRIQSSTASSCSPSSASSDDEYGYPHSGSGSGSPNYANPLSQFQIPKFPMGLSNNYGALISQPSSSVQERRMGLLRQLGLSRDPTLCRIKPSPQDDGEGSCGKREVGRSVSADHLNLRGRGGDVLLRNDVDSKPKLAGIVRSKSDSATDNQHQHHEQCNSNSPEILSINSISSSSSSAVVNETGVVGVVVNNRSSHNVVDKLRGASSGNGSPGAANAVASPNKPPTGKTCRQLEEIIRTTDSTGLNPNVNGCGFSSPVSITGAGGEVENDEDCNGANDGLVCTIKDLDNGKEFVVNEVRDDGMWNKLKEVGTGRQLTMEEFQLCVGHSPIVQELMRRQNVEDGNKDNSCSNVNDDSGGGGGGNGAKTKKKGSWLRSIKNSVTGHKERRSSDERDTSSEKGGRRSSSATDDSQDVSFHGPERIRVRHYGKSYKELTALYKSQEMQAHNGSIWTIKFSLDGKYLASAGEDCVVHVWQVVEAERKGDLLLDKPEDGNLSFLLLANGSPEPSSVTPNLDNLSEKKRRGRSSISRKSVSLDHVLVPETVFALSEKPICSFEGHLDDVLDLSWSKSQHLLSSSMDKTVRLWHLSNKSCLKIFSHSDYVTCIQFNPVDDRFFISGSLDAKVRVWSIPDRQVVDWNDLHEMVTAACYTPDGQAALVGSYKGSCRLYNTSENKLQQKSQINLQNKKKKSHHKKITGFQFAPGSTSEVLITSADSRIRVIDGIDLVHKFKETATLIIGLGD